MSLADLQLAAFSHAWLLEIAGLTVRFYSGQAPPTRAMSAGGNYTDVECLESVGSQSLKLNERGGISELGAVRVVLSSKGSTSTSTDPRKLLRRFSVRGASASCRLTQDIPHATANIASVTVDRDVTGWTAGAGGFYWFTIGQETFYAEGVAAGPDRFTTVHRAQLDSRPWPHTYSTANGQQPWITAEPVQWRGRRAILKVAAITGKALTSSDYHEVCRGFVDQTPALDQDGLAVALSIVPMTGVLKLRAVGDVQTTRLLQDYHLFTYPWASTIAHTQIAERGGLYADAAAGATLAGAGTLNVRDSDLHQRWADTAQPDEHPRRLPIEAYQQANVDPMLSTAYPAANQITLKAGEPSAAVANLTALQNALAWDVAALDLVSGPVGTETLVKWPADVLATINADTGWAPGQVTDGGGKTGRWSNVQITQDFTGVDGYLLVCKLNAAKPAQRLVIEFQAPWRGQSTVDGVAGDYYAGQGFETFTPEYLLWYGIDFAAPGEQVQPHIRSIAEDTQQTQGWVRPIYVSVGSSDGAAPTKSKIRGIARAFYQQGELSLLAEDDILSAGGWVQVEWTDPSSDDRQTQKVQIDSTATQNDGGGNPIGYKYTITDDAQRLAVRSFGDWPGRPRALIRPIARWVNTHPGQIILELLESCRGGAVNGTYDTQPFGLNLGSADIDEASFLSLPAPGPLALQTLDMLGDEDVGKAIEALLISCGATLAMRYDPATRTQRIAAVSVGLEFADDSVATITNGDLDPDTPVQSVTDDEVIARYQVKLNWDDAAGDFQTSVTFIDAEAWASQGGDAPSVDIELRGVRIDDVGTIEETLRPFVDGLRKRLGQPRLKLRFKVGLNFAPGLNIGDVVTVSIVDAVSYDATWGVSSLAGRVVGIEADWGGAALALDVVTYDALTAGWAPSLNVNAVVDVDTLTVDANAYTATTHPITGAAQADIDYFRMGDVVYIVPRGDFAGKVTKTVSGVSGNDISFTAAHGVAVVGAGYRIRPAAYDTTVARLRGYVFAADAARTLGAGADAAKVYS